jgi:hypothetical protein
MTNHRHNRPEWLSEANISIADAAERHGRIALLYSGGSRAVFYYTLPRGMA